MRSRFFKYFFSRLPDSNPASIFLSLKYLELMLWSFITDPDPGALILVGYGLVSPWSVYEGLNSGEHLLVRKLALVKAFVWTKSFVPVMTKIVLSKQKFSINFYWLKVIRSIPVNSSCQICSLFCSDCVWIVSNE